MYTREGISKMAGKMIKKLSKRMETLEKNNYSMKG